MSPNRLALGVLAAACVLAAGIGGYVASRQNSPAQASPAVQLAPLTPVTPAETSLAVEPPDTDAPPVAAPPETTVPPPAAVARPTAPVRTAPTVQPTRQSEPQFESKQRAPQDPDQTAASTGAPAAPALPPAASPPLLAQVQELTPPELPEPPPPMFEELVVPAESVIGLQNETTLSSDFARVEDRVEARVTRDVRVHGAIAIPAGSRAIGTVTEVDRGGRFRDRAQLSIRFDTIVLADSTRLPISTDPVTRYGDSPNGTAKVGGGAVAGAILGAILGGAKGAAVGATAGAGAGTAAAAVGGRNEATFAAGTPVTVRILAPITVTVERDYQN